MAATLLIALAMACVTPLPRPDQTAPPSPTATEAAAPTPTPTKVPEATPTPAPTAGPTSTPRPTSAPTQAPTPTLEPTPTRPADTPTPLPTLDAPEGLDLQVYAPEDGATVPGNTVVVYGQTTPGARVVVADVETEVDAQGGFRTVVPLQPEENEVVVVATGSAGGLKRVTRQVTSLALPFLLLITAPENESIVSSSILPLSGRTGPNAIVSINGRSVPVDRFGYFSSTVRLDEGPNIIDVVATNDEGQTLSSVLAVIYREPRE